MTTHAGCVALVTGANKSIGFEVAGELGKAGCVVLVGARNPELGERAAASLVERGIDARFLEIDLDGAETIAAAAAWVEKEFGRLDILVNNAAIISSKDGAPSVSDPDEAERVMRTNYVGTLRATQAFLPLVRKSAAGRIVNVSSGLGSLTQLGDPNWPYSMVKFLGYSASKAALNMLTVQLAWELRETGIKVNSSDPGYTATDFNQHRGTQTVAEGAAETVRLALLPDDGPTGGYFATEGVVPW